MRVLVAVLIVACVAAKRSTDPWSEENWKVEADGKVTVTLQKSGASPASLERSAEKPAGWYDATISASKSEVKSWTMAKDQDGKQALIGSKTQHTVGSTDSPGPDEEIVVFRAESVQEEGDKTIMTLAPQMPEAANQVVAEPTNDVADVDDGNVALLEKKALAGWYLGYMVAASAWAPYVWCVWGGACGNDLEADDLNTMVANLERSIHAITGKKDKQLERSTGNPVTDWWVLATNVWVAGTWLGPFGAAYAYAATTAAQTQDD